MSLKGILGGIDVDVILNSIVQIEPQPTMFPLKRFNPPPLIERMMRIIEV